MCGRTSFCLSPEEVETLYSSLAATGDASRQRQRQRRRGRGGGGGAGGGGKGESNEEQHQQLALSDCDRGRFRPSPNVAPTSSLPVLSRSCRQRGQMCTADAAPPLCIEAMKWGIATGSPSLPLVINARSETAAALASFSRLLSSPSGRGVVAADGYYEWESKQPYFVHRSDGAPMLLAALVEREARGGSGGGKGVGEDGGAAYQPRFVVLTRSPPKALRWLHERCPAIFPTDELAKEWLSIGSDSTSTAAREASELLSRAGAAVEASFARGGGGENGPKKRPPPLLSWHPVTKEMGKTSYQRSDASKDIRLGGIASLFRKAKLSTKKEKEDFAAVKKEEAVQEEEKEEEKSPNSHPSAFHSGAKRKQHEGMSSESNHLQQQQQQQSKKAKSAAAAAKTTTTTTPGKGQRSLEAFLTPKKEKGDT